MTGSNFALDPVLLKNSAENMGERKIIKIEKTEITL